MDGKKVRKLGGKDGKKVRKEGRMERRLVS
jgi:hypothetical protein